MSSIKPDVIISEFSVHRIARRPQEGEDAELPPADRKLFAELVRGVASGVSELDDMLSAVISEDWRVERLESILRAIMRCGAFELAHRQDVPPKVVISEYVAVADAFPAAAQAIADQYGCAIRSIDNILAAADIDAAVICTPTDTHADLIERFARAGKAIFCEKPIDLSLDRVKACLKVVRDTKEGHVDGGLQPPL